MLILKAWLMLSVISCLPWGRGAAEASLISDLAGGVPPAPRLRLIAPPNGRLKGLPNRSPRNYHRAWRPSRLILVSLTQICFVVALPAVLPVIRILNFGQRTWLLSC